MAKTVKPHEEIYRLRLRLGMSQVAFAQATGVHKDTVYRWETGNHTIAPTILKLARELANGKGARA